MFRLLIASTLLLSLISISLAGDLRIEISSPKDGEKVTQRPLVEGTVSDPKATVWVVVHPLEVSDYWVQPPVSIHNSGVWKVKIHIGRPGYKDIGKSFEIRAFANPVTDIREGEVLNNWPKAEVISDLIEVTRK